MTRSVLIIDDDDEVAMLLGRFSQMHGFEPRTVSSVKQARVALQQGKKPDLILLDRRLPDVNGLEYLPELRKKYPEVPVIMVTGEGELEHAVQAMKSGAADFLPKPVDAATLGRSLKRAVESAGRSQRPLERRIVGESAELAEVWRQLDLFAHTDITVLLLGESGTGKELFARAVHARSKRADGPFIELDCASIAPSLIESELFGHEKGAFTDAREARAGKFELASGGTLFLDEIGNLSLEVQAKLLRVVQERIFRRLGGEQPVAVDVRIVAATNADLEDSVRRGAFRNDLYFRLAELPLRLPPLRERSGDVRRLVEHYVADFAERFQRDRPEVAPEAMRALESYAWPGNVRELINVVRLALLRSGPRIELPAVSSGWLHNVPLKAPSNPSSGIKPLPAPESNPGSRRIAIPWPERDEDGLDIKQFLADVRGDLEREILTQLLHRRRMSKAQIARYLKLDYKVLLDKLRQYGLTPGGKDS